MWKEVALESRISTLVVEDDFFIALELKEHLESHGFDVIGPTSSLATARDILATHEPNVVLLDINMGRDGLSYDFALHVQRLGVPFVFITGYDAVAVNHAAFDDTPLLVKPVDLDAVVKQIELVCS